MGCSSSKNKTDKRTKRREEEADLLRQILAGPHAEAQRQSDELMRSTRGAKSPSRSPPVVATPVVAAMTPKQLARPEPTRQGRTPLTPNTESDDSPVASAPPLPFLPLPPSALKIATELSTGNTPHSAATPLVLLSRNSSFKKVSFGEDVCFDSKPRQRSRRHRPAFETLAMAASAADQERDADVTADPATPQMPATPPPWLPHSPFHRASPPPPVTETGIGIRMGTVSTICYEQEGADTGASSLSSLDGNQLGPCITVESHDGNPVEPQNRSQNPRTAST